MGWGGVTGCAVFTNTKVPGTTFTNRIAFRVSRVRGMTAAGSPGADPPHTHAVPTTRCGSDRAGWLSRRGQGWVAREPRSAAGVALVSETGLAAPVCGSLVGWVSGLRGQHNLQWRRQGHNGLGGWIGGGGYSLSRGVGPLVAGWDGIVFRDSEAGSTVRRWGGGGVVQKVHSYERCRRF